MSRSYRKIPISGNTMQASDKPFKKAEHKRARRALYARDLTKDEPPPEKAFGNPWGAPKDGKRWIDPKDWPRVWRK